MVSGSIKNFFSINSVIIYFSKSIVNYIFSILFQYIYKFGLPRIAYITFWVGTIYFPKIYRTVCNFLSMKSPVEINSLLSKFLCYIALSVISLDWKRRWTTCKRGLYFKSYCFFETTAKRITNYKLRSVVHKVTIDLLYFSDVFETPICEKKIPAELWLIHAEQVSLYKFHCCK